MVAVRTTKKLEVLTSRSAQALKLSFFNIQKPGYSLKNAYFCGIFTVFIQKQMF